MAEECGADNEMMMLVVDKLFLVAERNNMILNPTLARINYFHLIFSLIFFFLSSFSSMIKAT